MIDGLNGWMNKLMNKLVSVYVFIASTDCLNLSIQIDILAEFDHIDMMIKLV
jgi:hypothetical protein